MQPDGQFDPIAQVDSFTIQTITQHGIPQRSDEAQSFVGAIHSAEFGSSRSTLFVNFQYPSGLVNTIDFKSFAVDSVVLFFRPYAVYGMHADPISIEVVELAERIYQDTAYYSNSEVSVKPEVLGQAVWSRSQKSFEKATIMDENVERPFAFRIQLNKGFGEHLRDGLFTSYSDNESFQNFFHGICLRTPISALPANGGAIYAMALTTGESAIRIYLSKGGERERLDYTISASSARYNVFDHDYTGSQVAAHLLDTTPSQNKFYVQGLSGTSGRVLIPNLYTYASRAHHILSKATLTLEISPDQPQHLTPARQLYLLSIGEDNKEYLITDLIKDRTRFGGSRSGGKYTFDITRHIQNIIDQAKLGNNVDHGLSVHAQVPIINGNDTAMTIINAEPGAIKLRLFYTDLTD